MKKSKSNHQDTGHKTHISGRPREHYTIGGREKEQYKSEESAKRAARHMTRRYGEPIEAYRCSYCGCWHIGHRPLMPIEQRQLLLETEIDNLATMANHYRADLNNVAQQVLAISTKIDKLEELIWERYQQLLTLNNNKETK